MFYQKKVLVLSQLLDGFSLPNKRVSGIARLEEEDNICTLYLSTVNLKGNGYFGFISQGKKGVNFALSLSTNSAVICVQDFSNAESFSVGIYKDTETDFTLIAYASNEKSSVSDFKKLIYAEKKKRNKDIPSPLMPNTTPLPNIPNPFFPSTPENPNSPPGGPVIRPPNSYDDEALATENFYEKDTDFMEKLKIIEGIDNNVCFENGVPDFGNQTKAEENDKDFNGFQNEKDLEFGKEYGEQNPYYLSVKKDLDGIFEKFPAEENLNGSIPNSKWAKITYSKNKFYVVGLVYEKNREKYICYGVPAVYGTPPPKALEGFCTFVPVSLFDLKGKGFWMMFQSAITGKSITTKLQGDALQ